MLQFKLVQYTVCIYTSMGYVLKRCIQNHAASETYKQDMS